MRSTAKFTLKQTALLAFTVLIALTVVLSVSDTKLAQAQTYGVDFRNGVVKYVLTDRLPCAPETFEASIWIEEGVQGPEQDVGSIFSNDMRNIDGTVYAVVVDRYGHVCLNWNEYERFVTFDAVDVRQSRWVHIAVVRNKPAQSFELYVDGELAQTVALDVGTDIEGFLFNHVIGGDRLVVYAPSRYFEGKIRQVTAYSRVLTAAEIARDYANPDNIKASTRDSLFLNLQLSSKDVVAYDTSHYENDAYIGSTNYFYKGDFFKTQDYTLSVIPDWQMLTNHYHAVLHTMPDYLINNAERQKIKALITVGDIADGGNDEADWHRMLNPAKTQLNRLNGIMPYVPVPGNHDYDDECATKREVFYFNEAFPADKLYGLSGTFEGGSENAYYLVDCGAMKYIIFAMEFGARDAVLEWATGICNRYADHRVIVTTHSNLTACGNFDTSGALAYGWINKGVEANSPEQIWEKFYSKVPNMFMIFSGHVFSDDIIVNERVGDHGNIVASIVVNAQCIIMNDGLENLLALLTFDEKNQIMYFNYYSTLQEKFYNLQNQFVYSFKGNTDLVSTQYAGTPSTVNVSREDVLRSIVSGTGLIDEAQAPDTNDTAAIVLTVMSVAVVAILVVFACKRKEGSR